MDFSLFLWLVLVLVINKNIVTYGEEALKQKHRQKLLTVSDSEWSKLWNALSVMKHTSQTDGISTYGPKFQNYDRLVCLLSTTRDTAGNDAADFIAANRVLLLLMEQSLLSIDPSIKSIPYLDPFETDTNPYIKCLDIDTFDTFDKLDSCVQDVLSTDTFLNELEALESVPQETKHLFNHFQLTSKLLLFDSKDGNNAEAHDFKCSISSTVSLSSASGANENELMDAVANNPLFWLFFANVDRHVYTWQVQNSVRAPYFGLPAGELDKRVISQIESSPSLNLLEAWSAREVLDATGEDNIPYSLDELVVSPGGGNVIKLFESNYLIDVNDIVLVCVICVLMCAAACLFMMYGKCHEFGGWRGYLPTRPIVYGSTFNTSDSRMNTDLAQEIYSMMSDDSAYVEIDDGACDILCGEH